MRTIVWTIMLAAPLAGDDKKEDPAAAELKRLAGTWQGVAAEEGGEAAVADTAKQLRLEFDGEKFKAYFGDMVLMAGTLKLDPSAKPKAIDLKSSEGRLAGKTGEGIYELDGDKLKLCLVEPGEKRPAELKTAKQGQHLITYERAKK